MANVDEDAPARERLGWKAVVLIVAFQAAGLAAATYPAVRTLGTTLPERYDSLQHLWVMRWYKTCLIEGRSVFHCPEIQHPAGAPLGNFSPLHFQSLLYLPTSLVIKNDVLAYNLVWTFGLLMTGLGTSLLAWHSIRHRACAAFAGLLAMLVAPVMIHSHGHTELIFVGGFPLFLLAWMRLLDAPSRGRLASAALAYVVLAMSCAYFMVFAVFPAALYAAWLAARSGPRGAWPWLRGRAPWLLGFAGVCLPVLAVLFSSNLWAIAHGHSLTRPREEFNHYGAPIWSYAVPTPQHLLGKLLPWDPYAPLGATGGERIGYLGVVTVALLAYAAVCRVGLRRGGFLWAALALIVVLSLGASWTIGGRAISLPSAWLWHLFPPYRMTRVPARFCLFAGSISGVIAAGGLAHLLARLPNRGLRAAVFATCTIAAVADLSTVPFWKEKVPPMTGGYVYIRRHDPGATILEAPYTGSGGSYLNAACTYWQALHRLTTSAGYSGHANARQDGTIGFTSPLQASRLAEPDYLADPSKITIDLATDVDFRDYLWLYMTVHRFDYIVLHQWEGSMPELPVRLDRLKALLEPSKVYEDAAATVYARSRMPAPARPVQMSLGDWDRGQGRIAVYNPDSGRELTMVVDAAASWKARWVRLREGGRDVARWKAVADRFETLVSPPLRLSAGLHELTIDSEGGPRPNRPDPTPRLYPVRIARTAIHPAREAAPVAVRDRPEAESKTR